MSDTEKSFIRVVSKLLRIVKSFDADKIKELTADLRIKKAKNAQLIQKNLKTIEDNKEDPDQQDMIQFLINKVQKIEADNLNLEQ